jgi:hypothetical protein
MLVLAIQLAAVVALVGCHAWAPVVVADIASIAVFHRGLGDLVVSAVSGRDCSVVRLDQGRSYCVPREGPPVPPEFCTRSLGTVDCWAIPALVPNIGRPVADQPVTTAAQLADRSARWPNL